MVFKLPTIESFYDTDIRHYPYRNTPPLLEIMYTNYTLGLTAIAIDHPLVNGLIERTIDQFVLRIKSNNSQTIFHLSPTSAKYEKAVGTTPNIEVCANILRVWEYGGVEKSIYNPYITKHLNYPYNGMPPIKLL